VPTLQTFRAAIRSKHPADPSQAPESTGDRKWFVGHAGLNALFIKIMYFHTGIWIAAARLSVTCSGHLAGHVSRSLALKTRENKRSPQQSCRRHTLAA
jgi:hypothetical protein